MNITDFVNSLISAFQKVGSDMNFKADLINGKVPIEQLPPVATGDFIATSEKGAANGVATLGSDSKVGSSQLPSSALSVDIPLTQKGAANGVATLGNDGKVPSGQLPTLGSGTGEMSRPNFVQHYAGNGNGIANNNAAFIAAEADVYARIWLPEGRFLTTIDPLALFKRYEGPGIIQFAVVDNVDNRPRTNSRVYKKVFATSASDTINIGTNEPKGQDFGEIEYLTIPSNARSDLDVWALVANPPNGRPKYFWAPSYGHTAFYISKGGESGITGLLAASCPAGSTSAQILGGVVGWNVGDQVGFQLGQSVGGLPSTGFVTDTRTITSVDVTNARISWSGGLANNYTANCGVTKGYRTMNTCHYVQVESEGGGDHYAWCARMRMKHKLLDSQKSSIFFGETSGIIGGDMVAFEDYNCGTGWECQYLDQGHPTAFFNEVNTYFRQNASGAAGCVWIHDLTKMSNPLDANTLFVNPNSAGLHGLDGIWVAKHQARVGLDLTDCRFQVAAVALPKDGKLGFFANKVWTAPDQTNGNGYVCTKVGGYIMGRTDTTVGGDYLEFVIHPPGGGPSPGNGNSFFLRANSTQFFKDITMPYGHGYRWGTFPNDNSFIMCDGFNFYFYINGQVRTVL